MLLLLGRCLIAAILLAALSFAVAPQFVWDGGDPMSMAGVLHAWLYWLPTRLGALSLPSADLASLAVVTVYVVQYFVPLAVAGILALRRRQRA